MPGWRESFGDLWLIIKESVTLWCETGYKRSHTHVCHTFATTKRSHTHVCHTLPTMEGVVTIIDLRRASARKRKARSRANMTVREAEKIRERERKARRYE